MALGCWPNQEPITKPCDAHKLKGKTMTTATRTITLAKSSTQLLKPMSGLAAVLLILAASSPLAQARNPNPRVIPVNGTYRGLSYGEWGARWWQAVFSVPVVGGSHPTI